MDTSGFFAVHPKVDNRHARTEISDAAVSITLGDAEAKYNAPCSADGCGDTSENWICCSCLEVFCSRYVKGHMAAHAEASGHNMAFSFSDLSTWCYECDSYIVSKRSEAVKNPFYVVKFGTLPPNSTSGVAGAGAGIGRIIDPTGNGANDAIDDIDFSTAWGLPDAVRPSYPDPVPIEVDPEAPTAAATGAASPTSSSSSSVVIGRGTTAAPLVAASTAGNRARAYAHARPEDVVEYEEADDATLTAKIAELADLVRASPYTVAFTGAGISTAAGISDYRGPSGSWTLAAQGKRAKSSVRIDEAEPTAGHAALADMMAADHLHYVVTTNVDNLHRASGIPAEALSELHGNVFREVCPDCDAEFMRPYHVRRNRKRTGRRRGAHRHATGNTCDACGTGELRDTVVAFGEPMPPQETIDAFDASARAHLSIVLGTSMRVNPAAQMPAEALKRANGAMVIVNRQMTPYDHAAKVRIFASTDEVLTRLAAELSNDCPSAAGD